MWFGTENGLNRYDGDVLLALFYWPDTKILCSKYVNGKYTKAQKLGPEINKEGCFESNVFIAPDESYMIFGRNLENKYSDLFISIKLDNGDWSEAENIVELNTHFSHELYAHVHPSGRFIMFLSQRSGNMLPYWVDATIIEKYKY